ncbi:MAG: GDP-L-fucose synthase [Burkholderiales bacterium]|nr:GDP-L-fucose synthase [Burkholderiales bacterium]MCZ2135898.1 GDP-L-fucose synthase [Burkholderiales bacterium]
MDVSARIFVAGHRGLVGSALVRCLERAGATDLVVRSRAELDLTDQRAVAEFFARERPAYVFLAAAKVGGIKANDTYPAEFLRENLAIQTNVIHSAWQTGVRKLCFLGSSCIYPKLAPQPMAEDALLTGPLEPTNEWYAVAKIAGIKMCQAYRRQYGFDAISVMPTNLYGPGDNFDLQNSHVLPAMIRRFHEAKLADASSVTIWGSGTPRREFLHVDDMAEACVFLMRQYTGEMHVNVGVGEDLTILDLAAKVAAAVGYRGAITTDPTKPDGTPRKLMDVGRIHAMGWRARIGLDEGIADTYRWYLDHASEVRGASLPST